MSNFTKENLAELYNKYLPTFGELLEIANKEQIDFEINITASGKIEIISRNWSQTESGSRTLEKIFIRQTKESVSDGEETIVYE